MWPAIPFLGTVLRGKKKMSMQKFALQCSSAVLLTEAKKWKHPYAEQPVSGKTVAYPYNRILFAHRN